jgi:hypothetical protein
MPYLAGVVSGVLLTIVVVFMVDTLTVASDPIRGEPKKIVNWDVAAEKLRSSFVKAPPGKSTSSWPYSL